MDEGIYVWMNEHGMMITVHYDDHDISLEAVYRKNSYRQYTCGS